MGGTVEDGVAVASLHALDVPLVLRRSCNRALACDGAISINMICAGYPAGGRDACQGDSGGPLTIDVDIDEKKDADLGRNSQLGGRLCTRGQGRRLHPRREI